MRKDFLQYKQQLFAPFTTDPDERSPSPRQQVEEEIIISKTAFHEIDEVKTFYDLIRSNSKSPSK